jgi:hypothetical protein
MAGLSAQKVAEEIRQRHRRFVELIKRQEELARTNPGAYKLKVRLLAALGYGYIYAVLLLLILLLAGTVLLLVSGKASYLGVKLLIFVVPVAFLIARSLFLKIERPEGLQLQRSDAPKLFDEIESIRHRLGSIKVQKVILDNSFNAAAAQLPKWGAIGPTRCGSCWRTNLATFPASTGGSAARSTA